MTTNWPPPRRVEARLVAVGADPYDGVTMYEGPYPAPRPHPRNEETWVNHVDDREVGCRYIRTTYYRVSLFRSIAVRWYEVTMGTWRYTAWTEPGGRRMGSKEWIEWTIEDVEIPK